MPKCLIEREAEGPRALKLRHRGVEVLDEVFHRRWGYVRVLEACLFDNDNLAHPHRACTEGTLDGARHWTVKPVTLDAFLDVFLVTCIRTLRLPLDIGPCGAYL